AAVRLLALRPRSGADGRRRSDPGPVRARRCGRWRHPGHSEHPDARRPALGSVVSTETEVEPEETGTRRPAGAVLVLGAIGLLLLGAVAGVLLRMPLDKADDPAPGPVDIGFSQDMAAHHAQAVDMAGVALIASTDNDVRRLA